MNCIQKTNRRFIKNFKSIMLGGTAHRHSRKRDDVRDGVFTILLLIILLLELGFGMMMLALYANPTGSAVVILSTILAISCICTVTVVYGIELYDVCIGESE